MSLLGIDVGTTGCKVTALSAEGQVLGSAGREYDVLRPHSGWAELDSQAVWSAIRASIHEAAQCTTADPIAALSVSSMGEAMTPVSRDRRILGNCLLGFDVRGREVLELLATLDPHVFFERSGNVASTIYGGQKLIWLRDHRPELFEAADKFLSWADLVAYLLGGEVVTDYSLANRSLFLDLSARTWSVETLTLVGMPPDKLPPVVPAGTVVGTVKRSLAAELGLPDNVAIVIGGHDQCVSALGAGVIQPGLAAYGLGTYICISPAFSELPNTASMVRSKLNVEHHVVDGLYLSFYYNLTGGALLKWFRNTLAPQDHMLAKARGEDIYTLLLAEMPNEPTDMLVLPHFAPTGPPLFDGAPLSIIAGLTLETDRGTLIKGLLEGVTYYFREGLDILSEAGIPVEEYRVTGGGARSDAWLQMKADILGRPLARPKVTEAGAMGAAILAGVGAGVYSSIGEAVETLIKLERHFDPDMRRHALYEERFARYRLLYPLSRELQER
jgi:xylulokinase